MDGLNPITRKEVYLAKASGDQVETPEPITREEMYLKKIAEGGGGSSLPDTPAEDGTYALQNTVEGGESMLSWASGGSGGGVLVVNVIPEGETTMTMDKTWQEIYDAPFSVARVQTGPTSAMLCQIYNTRQQDSEYSVSIIVTTGEGQSLNFAGISFHAESANDYPTTGK